MCVVSWIFVQKESLSLPTLSVSPLNHAIKKEQQLNKTETMLCLLARRLELPWAIRVFVVVSLVCRGLLFPFVDSKQKQANYAPDHHEDISVNCQQSRSDRIPCTRPEYRRLQGCWWCPHTPFHRQLSQPSWSRSGVPSPDKSACMGPRLKSRKYSLSGMTESKKEAKQT